MAASHSTRVFTGRHRHNDDTYCYRTVVPLQSPPKPPTLARSIAARDTYRDSLRARSFQLQRLPMGAPMPEASKYADASHSTIPTSNNDENNAVSLEATYTCLIQEYLQVMCLENATFLAERLVASCKSSNALYLLAVCHYRSGAPKRALMVLDEVRDAIPSADYLKAKCCCDLEYYGRAEEALLHQARAVFNGLTTDHPSTSNKTMDEWILETTPCPVPNGAAGLHLLGNICRKSNRKQRAMKYYRMSLQVS